MVLFLGTHQTNELMVWQCDWIKHGLLLSYPREAFIKKACQKGNERSSPLVSVLPHEASNSIRLNGTIGRKGIFIIKLDWAHKATETEIVID
jgi:hypothetical protein